MTTEHNRPLAYLRYATAEQIWTDVKGGFLAWVVLTILCFAFIEGMDLVGVKTAPWTARWTSPLPGWLCIAVAICAILWFLNGRTLRIAIPKLTFKEWLLSSVLIILMAFLWTVFPMWVALSFYWGVGAAAYVVESLAERGKENYAHLSKGGATEKQKSAAWKRAQESMDTFDTRK